MEVRGRLKKNAPPHPGPLLHPMEEREKTSQPVVLTVSPAGRYFLAKIRLASSSVSLLPMSYQRPGTRQVKNGVRG